MHRKEMLARLKAIERPIITSYGAFDTGIEFKILTHERGHFCMGGGTWPIEGPIVFGKRAFAAVRKVLEVGYENDPSWNNVDVFLTEIETHTLSKAEVSLLTRMDEVQLNLLIQMVQSDCSPGKKYYVYSGDCATEKDFYPSYEAAEDYLITAFTECGTLWEEMDDADLDSWIVELDAYQGHA